jgi:hypothetical protein
MEAKYVSTGKPKIGGAVFRAPVGTTMPTSATESLAAGFIDLGYCSEDGVSNNNSAETEEIKAWGGEVVLVPQTGKPDEFTFTLIEALNENVLATIYGDAHVTANGTAGTIYVEATAEQQPELAYVIDVAMKGGAMKRLVIPAATLKEVGEIVYKDDEAIGYEITIAAMPDASGVTHKEYIKLASGTDVAIALDHSTLSVAKDASSQLTATTTPAGGRVVWGTSDPTKVTVDATGLVTSHATSGSATVTAYYAGVTATCTVTCTS